MVPVATGAQKSLETALESAVWRHRGCMEIGGKPESTVDRAMRLFGPVSFVEMILDAYCCQCESLTIFALPCILLNRISIAICLPRFMVHILQSSGFKEQF